MASGFSDQDGNPFQVFLGPVFIRILHVGRQIPENFHTLFTQDLKVLLSLQGPWSYQDTFEDDSKRNELIAAYIL